MRPRTYQVNPNCNISLPVYISKKLKPGKQKKYRTRKELV